MGVLHGIQHSLTDGAFQSESILRADGTCVALLRDQTGGKPPMEGGTRQNSTLTTHPHSCQLTLQRT
jgi:hypothetical protein